MFMFWYGPSDAVNLRRKVSVDIKFNYKHFNQVCQSWKVMISPQCALALEATWAQQEDPGATEAESGTEGHWGPLWRYAPSLLMQHRPRLVLPTRTSSGGFYSGSWIEGFDPHAAASPPSALHQLDNEGSASWRGTWRLSLPSAAHPLDSVLVLGKLPSLFSFNKYFLSTLLTRPCSGLLWGDTFF